MKPTPEQVDLSRSWTFVEPRDRHEDAKLWKEIESLGLPTSLIDAHVHCGRKEDVGDVPLERLQKVKALNNHRWYHLSRMRQLHRSIFPDRRVDFVAFPIPFLETNIAGSNNYLLEGARINEHILILGNPNDVDDTIQTISNNRERVAGVKAYYDQIPVTSERDPEDVSTFEFFPKELLAYLNDQRLAIMLHVPRQEGLAHPETLSEVQEMAGLFPNLKIILAHMGRCYNPYAFKQVIGRVQTFDNIIFESSMVDDTEVFNIALLSVGHERLLFGTDLPMSQVRFLRVLEGRNQNVLSKQESYALRIYDKPDMAIGMNVYYMTRSLLLACHSQGLSQEQVEDVFYNNAYRLFKSAVEDRSTQF